MSRYFSSLCGFRRDLRSEDHAALHAALTASDRVFCAFVFDTGILDKLPDRSPVTGDRSCVRASFAPEGARENDEESEELELSH